MKILHSGVIISSLSLTAIAVFEADIGRLPLLSAHLRLPSLYPCSSGWFYEDQLDHLCEALPPATHQVLMDLFFLKTFATRADLGCITVPLFSALSHLLFHECYH